MSATIRVRAYLNTTTVDGGLPIGMLFGYQPEHELVLAFETTVMGTSPDHAVCEQVFRLLNIGDDPEVGTPDPRAVAYRQRGHRSMSPGDVVSVDDRFYACASAGFDPIDPPARLATR
ncbi:MAG TPA: hypothetical protein VJT31_26255 [Rugosimonospora sp.]|nr:hypothetical protein [Rugosimonospora sp.]